MATASNVNTITATAGSAVSVYRFVSLAADGKYDHTGANVRADGVSAEAAAADTDIFAMAQLQGVMKLESGAAVSVGDLISSDSTGRAVTATATVDFYNMGVARSISAGAGEIIEVLLHSPDRDPGS